MQCRRSEPRLRKAFLNCAIACMCEPQGALVTMVAGAVVAGLSDLTYNRTGYIWTFICIFATAAYLIAIKWCVSHQPSRPLIIDPISRHNASPLLAGMVSHQSVAVVVIRSKEKTGVTEQDLLMYNNLIALPIMIVYLVAGTSELKTVMDYPRLYDLDFQVSSAARSLSCCAEEGVGREIAFTIISARPHLQPMQPGASVVSTGRFSM